MATSSIIENIRVNNPQVLEEYIAFMETSASSPLQPRKDDERSDVVTDSSRIRNFVRKALEKKGL